MGAIETLSACGSVPPTHSLPERAATHAHTHRCTHTHTQSQHVGLLRSTRGDDSVCVCLSVCAFVKKLRVHSLTHATTAAIAKTTHPQFFRRWEGGHTGPSASGFTNAKRQGETGDNGQPLTVPKMDRRSLSPLFPRTEVQPRRPHPTLVPPESSPLPGLEQITTAGRGEPIPEGRPITVEAAPEERGRKQGADPIPLFWVCWLRHRRRPLGPLQNTRRDGGGGTSSVSGWTPSVTEDLLE